MAVDVGKHLDSLGVTYIEDSKRFLICCPFHDDEHPSCGVLKRSGFFRCFACGEDGDFAKLIAEIGDMSLEEAQRALRGEDRLSDMEDNLRSFLHEDEDRLRYFGYSSFMSTYPPVVPETPEWEYLVGRRLTAETIGRFNIRRGVKKYQNRVVIPIFTVEGKLLSYVGRAIRKGMVPKTRKSRSPHRTLFGLFELLRDAPSPNRRSNLVVVEGEFDAMYLQQCGIPAVANMGTIPFGPKKIALVRKYGSKLILAFDGDEAGEKAMYGSEKKVGMVRLLSPHIPTVSIRLPEGMDPNDLSEEQVGKIFGGIKR